MYTEFYGLKELPFALTPDPRFIYFTPSHTEVMANLHYGIESGKGLIVVTGEVGTGKTTMLRWVMQRLDRTVMVAYIFNPRLSVAEFYQHLAALLDIQNWETKSDLLLKLGEILDSRHSRGLRTVLVVDEAHGLSASVLEEIRLLCNFESDTAKKLQIVLTGQPELRNVLNNPDLRQLKQRVSLRCDISALPNVEETAQYCSPRFTNARSPTTPSGPTTWSWVKARRPWKNSARLMSASSTAPASWQPILTTGARCHAKKPVPAPAPRRPFWKRAPAGALTTSASRTVICSTAPAASWRNWRWTSRSRW